MHMTVTITMIRIGRAIMIGRGKTIMTGNGETMRGTGEPTTASGENIAMTGAGEKYTPGSGVTGINGTETMTVTSTSMLPGTTLNLILTDNN